MSFEKYYIYFTEGEKEEAESDRFVVAGTKNIDKECASKKWLLGSPSRIYFHLNATKDLSYNVALHFTADSASSNLDLTLTVGINDATVQTLEHLIIEDDTVILPISDKELRGNAVNTLSIDATYTSGSALYIDHAVVEEMYNTERTEKEAAAAGPYARPSSNCNWMNAIMSGTLLTSISIPGTHDSCAIRKGLFRSVFSCQDHTLTEQLHGGIRFLDIRVGLTGKQPTDLITCHESARHGDYQKLYTAFDEVTSFLKAYPSECVIMSLKIDDWADYEKNHSAGLSLLVKLMEKYNSYFYKSPDCPNLGMVRGKIYLINRIDDTLRFGVPIDIPDDTEGSMLDATANRNFKVYVQDKYDFNFHLPIPSYIKKWKVVRATLDKRTRESSRSSDMYLCYCNGFRRGCGVYVMGNVMNYLGESASLKGRPYYSPWMIFDYPFWTSLSLRYGWMNVVDAIIDLNFAYFGPRYPKTYHVYHFDGL